MGAGLLVVPADLAGQAERGGVLDAGLFVPAGSEEEFTEAVECIGLIVPIALVTWSFTVQL